MKKLELLKELRFIIASLEWDNLSEEELKFLLDTVKKVVSRGDSSPAGDRERV